MTIDRSIAPGGYSTGTDLAADLADTLNYALGLSLGDLSNVAGTNSITAEIDEPNGFSSLTTGATATLTPAVTNTGAVTLQIQDSTQSPIANLTSAISVKTNAGGALAASDLVAGKAYPIQYFGSDGASPSSPEWRVLVDVPSQDTSASTDVPPYTYVVEQTSSGTWTAPFDCYVRIWAIGGGGSGGASGNRAAGGGAGGVSVKDRFYMASGEQLTINVAAGGAAATGVSTGNDGGATTVTGPNSLSMAANGGKGGAASNSSVTVNGGAGGTASGGDINITGQAGATGNTNDTGTTGGRIGLLTTPAALATGSTGAGEHPISDEYSVIKAIGPFTNSSPLAGGHGHTAAGSPGAGQTGGGGGGGGDLTSTDSGAGGDGIVVIEHTTEIAA